LEKLAVKYLTENLNEKELNKLMAWLEKPGNKDKFKTYVRANRNLDTIYKDMDEEKAYQAILRRINNNKTATVRKLYWKVAKYAAAIFIIALASTYFLRDTIFNGSIENATPIIVNNKIEPGIDKATLTLETGEQITLVKGASIQTQNATSNGEQIIYEADNAVDKLAYNYLTVPRGGQFQITLADGTKVWLNSESRLKYPVNFIAGESRQVELVYGEAYFDVSPSTEHKGSDFKVFNNQQEVQVLGTQFNIKAYKDETHIYTTLAEGKVAVNYHGKTQDLSPGQQTDLNSNTNMITVSAVNVDNEISWKEGIFDFKDKPLKEIMKTLSRWYDMEVEFQNQDLQNEHFNGRLKKQYSIEEIMATIKASNIIDTYEINNKKVILK